MSFDNPENDIEKIRKNNKKLLVRFKKWLLSNKLSSRTIDKHCQNVSFYINEFLSDSEYTYPDEGWDLIGMYFSCWFLRKAAWANVGQIKPNVASLKLFYEFLYEINQIEKDDLDNLKKIIEEGMPKWIKSM